MDEDFMVALQLQEQFDNEYESSLLSPTNFDENSVEQSSKKRKVEYGGNSIPTAFLHPSSQVERPMSIVDESWEILDPSPDVRAMFLEFNDMFFGGQLSGVEVKWSPRMTLCAGLCSYEGRGGLCSIRLSEPLLKLRPRRDLVQTLLHEMIHALLFVTQNNRDRDGHGPEFCKHMDRINTATGTKITVYHTFHDEVDLYRQHWWKCNGPCQNQKPYFGFVKRAMNRAPSACDPWWGDHQRTCGGTYNKVKEPEGYGKKKGKAQSNKDNMAEGKMPVGNAKPSSTAIASSGSQDIRNMIPFSGKGVLLGWVSQPSASQKPPEPVLKIPFPSPISSPKRPPFSPPPQNNLGSPTDTLLDSLGKNSSGTLPLTRPRGNKPPTKRSVGNTKYFVSINGSPVRIPKPHGGKGGLAASAKQRSVKELFDSFSVTESNSTGPKPLTDSNAKTPSSPGSSLLHLGRKQNSTDSSTIPRQQVNPPSTLSKYPSGVPTMSKPSPTKPTQSKYFGSQGAPGAASVSAVPSRKRSWNERGGSPSLLDFFSMKAGSSGSSQGQARAMGSSASAAFGSSGEHQRTATATVTSNTVATSSSHFPSSSSVSSSSTALHNASTSSVSLPLMVSCPVCQAKVQESQINEHLDSCLF